MAKGNSSAGGGSASCSTEQTGNVATLRGGFGRSVAGKADAAAFLEGRDLAVEMLKVRVGDAASIEAKHRDGAAQDLFVLRYLDRVAAGTPGLREGFAAVLSDCIETGSETLPEVYSALSYAEMRAEGAGAAPDAETPRSRDDGLQAYDIGSEAGAELTAIADLMLRTGELDSYVCRALAMRVKQLQRVLAFCLDNQADTGRAWDDIRAELTGVAVEVPHG